MNKQALSNTSNSTCMCEKISKLTFWIVSFDGNNKQFITFRIYNLLEANNSYGTIHVQTDNGSVSTNANASYD